jgi:putative DNA primase/helicase
MQAERKNQDPFEMQPTTKHLFSANRAPGRSTDDEAFWNRWLTVIFPETIPRTEQDPSLTDSLTTDDELSGILNWAIKGYQRLSEQGHFTNEPTPADNRERWEQFGSSVERFFDAHLETDPEAQVPKSEAYDAYTDFASDLGMEVVPQSSLTRQLKQKEGVGDSQRRIDGERTRVYTGIRQTDD